MTTKLDKPVRREVTVGDVAYTLTIDPDGLKLVQKGHRKGHELRWQDIVNGDAAIAAALQGSLQDSARGAGRRQTLAVRDVLPRCARVRGAAGRGRWQ